MYTEDDLIPLSALQHLLFCARQCALIHIEQLWQENLFIPPRAGLCMNSRPPLCVSVTPLSSDPPL